MPMANHGASEQAEALSALYQAERQDLTGILAQSIALVGLSLDLHGDSGCDRGLPIPSA